MVQSRLGHKVVFAQKSVGISGSPDTAALTTTSEVSNVGCRRRRICYRRSPTRCARSSRQWTMMTPKTSAGSAATELCCTRCTGVAPGKDADGVDRPVGSYRGQPFKLELPTGRVQKWDYGVRLLCVPPFVCSLGLGTFGWDSCLGLSGGPVVR